MTQVASKNPLLASGHWVVLEVVLEAAPERALSFTLTRGYPLPHPAWVTQS